MVINHFHIFLKLSSNLNPTLMALMRKETQATNNQNSFELLSFVKDRQKNQISTSISTAIGIGNTYIQEPIIVDIENEKSNSPPFNLVKFWANYHCKHSQLIDSKYLCIPATSVPSEEVFSNAGNFITKKGVV